VLERGGPHCERKSSRGIGPNSLSSCTILQVLSSTLFEKIPISGLFQRFETGTEFLPHANQLGLFDY